jgi:hypothetical protein
MENTNHKEWNLGDCGLMNRTVYSRVRIEEKKIKESSDYKLKRIKILGGKHKQGKYCAV